MKPSEELDISLDCKIELWPIHVKDCTLQGLLLHPDTKPRAAIVLLHGFAANRYSLTPYAKVFVESGYLVATYDARGHGESGGTLDSILSMVDDVGSIAEKLKEKYDLESVGLFGMSMGGLVSTIAAAEHESIDAVAVMGGATDIYNDFKRLSPPMGTLVRLAYSVMDRIGKSGKEIHIPKMFSNSLVNRKNLWALEIIVEDLSKLFFSIPGLADLSLNHIYRLFKDSPDARGYAGRVTVPFLSFHGAEDSAIPFAAAKELYDAIASPEKVFVVLNGRHNIWSRKFWRVSKRVINFFDTYL